MYSKIFCINIPIVRDNRDMKLYIFVKLLQMIGITLPYDNLTDIRSRLEEVAPHLVRYGDVEPANFFTQALEIAKVCILIEQTLI